MRIAAAAAMAVGIIVWGVTCTMAEPPAAPDKTVEIVGTKKSVFFNHDTHKEYQCVECHHLVEEKEEFRKCATEGCHDDLKERKPPSFYGVMHAKKDVKFSTCATCHQKLAKEAPDRKKELSGCKGSKCHPE